MKQYFEKLVSENVFPGCTYAIIHNDKIEIDFVGNKALFPKIEKNNIDTLYDLASLTKIIVTNTIITKLLQNNIISLNDKVNKYLPKFKYDEITIYHLLTHSSGLIADVDWTQVNNKEELIDLFYNKELYYEIGKDVIYSDINFIFLGFIIEKIYQKPLDKIANEEVFIPLNMTNTGYLPKNKELCAPTEITLERGIVKGIVHDEKACLLDGIAGSAGVFSNINDLVKFVNMILNDGMINEKEFIKREYIDLWFKPLVENKNGLKRGLAWVVGNGRVAGQLCSNQTISHTGFTGTTIIIDRKRKLAFIQLSNRIHPNRKNELLLDQRGIIFDKIIKKYNL